MKTTQTLAVVTIFMTVHFAFMTRAADITAISSGSWGDPSVWQGGIVPGTNDNADIEAPYNITVDTNASAQVISGSGTVTMATNSTLTILGNFATYQLTNLNTTAAGNTVIYAGNPFYAKQCNYYNLVFANTNYVDPAPPYLPYQYFNNFSSVQGPTPMTIAGNMTLLGHAEVQQGSGGAPITIAGNLTIGEGCAWDCSGDNLTVVSNAYIYGLLEDLNGALGSNYIGGNVIVAGPSTSVPVYAGGPYTNGWYVSDVITWGLGGNLTNNGSIFGSGFGSIFFDGTGIIAGSNGLTIPTLTVNGTYKIGTTITLITNTPDLHGTVIFDIATTNKIILNTYPSNPLTNYYSGNLVVINSGAAPTPGKSYQLFSAPYYNGTFDSTSFPPLSGGLSWIDNLATSGSITVSGSLSAPTLSFSRNGSTLSLSWDSTTFPGFSVKALTNSSGLRGGTWSPAGSGTTSPFQISIDSSKPAVFFRLSNP